MSRARQIQVTGGSAGEGPSDRVGHDLETAVRNCRQMLMGLDSAISSSPQSASKIDQLKQELTSTTARLGQAMLRAAETFGRAKLGVGGTATFSRSKSPPILVLGDTRVRARATASSRSKSLPILVFGQTKLAAAGTVDPSRREWVPSLAREVANGVYDVACEFDDRTALLRCRHSGVTLTVAVHW